MLIGALQRQTLESWNLHFLDFLTCIKNSIILSTIPTYSNSCLMDSHHLQSFWALRRRYEFSWRAVGTRWQGGGDRPPHILALHTKMEFTVCYTRQITALFTDISIKIHRFVCIKPFWLSNPISRQILLLAKKSEGSYLLLANKNDGSYLSLCNARWKRL